MSVTARGDRSSATIRTTLSFLKRSSEEGRWRHLTHRRLLTKHSVNLCDVLGLLATTFILAGCVAESNAPMASQVAIPRTVDTATRPVTPSDLIALRDIGGYRGAISVSPDAEHVVFQIQQGDVAENRYLTGWFVASTAPGSGEVISLGDGGEVLLSGESIGRISGTRLDATVRWSPDSQWIAYLVKHDDEVQLWRSRRDGGIQEQLTNNNADVTEFAWSADGKRLFFEVGRDRSKMQAALAREGESGFLFDERFIVHFSTAPVLADSAQGNVSDQNHGSVLWVYELQTAAERPATDKDAAAYEALGADLTVPHIDESRSLRAVVPNRESGAFAWLEYIASQEVEDLSPPLTLHASTTEGVEIRCAAPECTGRIDKPLWSFDGTEAYFVRREGVNNLQRGFYAWEPVQNTLRTILRTDDWITNCQPAADRLVCLHESPTTPRKIIAMDPADGTMDTLIDPNPEFQHLTFTPVEKLEWKEATAGADAAGHLVYPVGYESGTRYPLVIVQYRSLGFLRGGIGDEYPIHPLAANGFFVLSFDRPGRKPGALATTGDIYERERADWGEDLWERSSALSALEVVIDQLDERALIDPTKVGITGLSDGAETVWYAMMYSRRFAAAAASSGSWSPSMYYLLNESSRKNLFRRAAELLPPGMGGDDRWKRISPEFHADRIDTPILVQVADHELVVSAATIGALTDAGKPIETYVYPDEYHIKVQPRHKLSVHERSIDWFNFWLRGVEDSDPEKSAQYERWHKLASARTKNVNEGREL